MRVTDSWGPSGALFARLQDDRLFRAFSEVRSCGTHFRRAEELPHSASAVVVPANSRSLGCARDDNARFYPSFIPENTRSRRPDIPGPPDSPFDSAQGRLRPSLHGQPAISVIGGGPSFAGRFWLGPLAFYLSMGCGGGGRSGSAPTRCGCRSSSDAGSRRGLFLPLGDRW